MIPAGLSITAEEWEIVRTILQRYVPDREVWAFGSRVKGPKKPFSDLDLAVVGDAPMPLETQASLSDAFTESDLPYKVDIVDWATTSERFQAIIASHYVALPMKT